MIKQLQAHADDWAQTDAPARAALLRACLTSTLAVAEEGARAGTRHKGSFGTGIGEEL